MTDPQIERLIKALERLSTGGDSYATGCEALTLALAGSGIDNPVGSSLQEVAVEIGKISEALLLLASDRTGRDIKEGLFEVGAAIRELSDAVDRGH
jgi:hypothetical protein